MVRWPLWNPFGLEDDNPAYIEGVLGLSTDLILDIQAWSARAEEILGSNQITRKITDVEFGDLMKALDTRALELVERLQAELPSEVTVYYQS